MDTIELCINTQDSNFNKLECTIDQHPVEYTRTADKVVINTDMAFGIHQLRVKLVDTNERISIADVRLNGAGIRMLIYLSYIETASAEKLQPATVLWDNSQTWVLPIGNPVSSWISLVYQKINNSNFGKNLYEKFHIYYPESMTIPAEYPTVVKTFFQHDFDFVCLPKDTAKHNLPFYPCDVKIDPELLQAAAREVAEKRSFIVDNQQPIIQSEYNDREDWDKEKSWIRIFLLIDDPVFTKDTLPNLWALIDSIDLKGKYRILLGILPPGGAIAPHCDRVNNKPVDYRYLYVPLNWPPGNYFKFNGAGIIDSAQANYVNIWDYTHSVINTSNQDRAVIGIYYRPDEFNVQSKI